MRRISRCVVVLCLSMLLAGSVFANDMLHVDAPAAIAVNPQTNEIVWEQNAHVQRPIASLTKMMTAAVLFDTDVDMTRDVLIETADVRGASTTKLRPRDHVTTWELVHLMLIASDNGAARALARTTAGSIAAFVQRMNAKARALSLTETHYADPAGLLATNTSSAYDMARLLQTVSMNDRIASVMRLPSFSTRIGKRSVVIQSTNHLVRDGAPVMAGKTGFTSHSGFCLASLLGTPNQAITIVVLGAKTNTARFAEVMNVYTWAKTRLADAHEVLQGIPEEVLRVGQVCVFPDSVSTAAVAFIKRHEGFFAHAYRDSGGYAIGYGMHRWKGKMVTRKYPGRINRSQADVEFARQLSYYESIVRESVCSYMTQSAYDSLVSVAWNLGRVNTRIIKKMTSAGTVNASDFLSTATVRGRLNANLVARRTHEFAMFNGVYNE